MMNETNYSLGLHAVVINCLLTSFRCEGRVGSGPALPSPADLSASAISVPEQYLNNELSGRYENITFTGGKKRCEGIGFTVTDYKEKGVHHV